MGERSSGSNLQATNPSHQSGCLLDVVSLFGGRHLTKNRFPGVPNEFPRAWPDLAGQGARREGHAHGGRSGHVIGFHLWVCFSLRIYFGLRLKGTSERQSHIYSTSIRGSNAETANPNHQPRVTCCFTEKELNSGVHIPVFMYAHLLLR